jgi:hypothetical protein
MRWNKRNRCWTGAVVQRHVRYSSPFSEKPATMRVPSGENEIELTGLVCPRKGIPTGSPVPASHNRTVVSQELVTIAASRSTWARVICIENCWVTVGDRETGNENILWLHKTTRPVPCLRMDVSVEWDQFGSDWDEDLHTFAISPISWEGCFHKLYLELNSSMNISKVGWLEGFPSTSFISNNRSWGKYLIHCWVDLIVQ